MAERYAEIVANSGINAKVQPDVWSKAVAAMRQVRLALRWRK